jgi:uncharacterized delta-60 repeat protein
MIAVRYTASNQDFAFGNEVIAGSLAADTDGEDVIAYNHSGVNRVLIAGSTRPSGALIPRPLVVALRSDGQLDTTWSGDGLVSNLVPGSTDTRLTGIARQSGAKIVVAGSATQDGRRKAFVARYTSAGELDTSFSGDGMQIISVRRNIAGRSVQAAGVTINDVAIDNRHHRILLVGSARYPSLGANATSALTLARHFNGTPDNGWHGDGVHHVALGAAGEWFNAVAFQPSGRAVIVGAREIPSDPAHRSAALTLRLRRDGHLNLSYGGGNGVTRFDIGGQLEASDVVVRDGRIIVVCRGFGFAGATDAFRVLRYMGNGDADFEWGGGDAVVRTDMLPGDEWANAVAVRPDGIVAVAGAVAEIGGRVAIEYLRPS